MNSNLHSISKLLSEHQDSPYDPEKREFVEDIASALYERYEDLPSISDWPTVVRYFFACYDLNYQVGNGGFAQATQRIHVHKALERPLLVGRPSASQGAIYPTIRPARSKQPFHG